MSPSAKALREALERTVRDIWHSDEREQLSVNLVRQRVESELKLDEGFFKDEDWKTKSKDIIRAAVDAQTAEAPSSQAAAPEPSPAKQKNGAKKRSSIGENDAPAKKRQKKAAAPPRKVAKPKPKPKPKSKAKAESDSELSELSELSDASEEEARKPKPKKRVVKARPAKRKAAESDSDDDEQEDDLENKDDVEEETQAEVVVKTTSKPKPTRPTVVTQAAGSDDESPLSDVKDEDLEDMEEKAPAALAVDDDSSELSDVIDEPPKRKRKSKDPSAKSAPKPKAAASKDTTDLSPDDAEIKKLQGQLLKCGVRKVWAFELKQYGDDKNAKLRHLRGMLKDLGMDGRFSEAKAREIKERRELQADLEAVTAMNDLWGMKNGRSSRSKAAKSMQEVSSDDEGGGAGGGPAKDDEARGDSDENADEDAKPHARGRGSAKYRAELAFLDDESESE